MTIVSDYTAILSGARWNSVGSVAVGQPVFVSFSFLENHEVDDPEYGITYSAFSANQRVSFRDALTEFESVASVRFIEVDDPANAMLRVSNASDAAPYYGSGSFPRPLSVSNLYINDTGDYHRGSHAFQIILHEMGHIMGLKHPHDNVTSETTLEPNLDNDNNTLMSVHFTWPSKSHLKNLDIDALQYYYGDNADFDPSWTWNWSNTTNHFTLTGGSNNDILIAIRAPSTLEGGSGDDKLFGQNGNDILNGGSGGDKLFGQYGNDILNGGSGDDTLEGGVGEDTLEGGAGNDILDGGEDYNWWGSEIRVGYGDVASFESDTQGVSVTLTDGDATSSYISGGTASGAGIGTDTLINIEHIRGGSGNDTLTGNGLKNILEGGEGDDTLIGGGGKDALIGGEGSDTASYIDATSGVTVSLAISGAQYVHGNLGSDTLTSIENLKGSDFGDNLTGNSGINVLVGGGGNDVLDGGEGAAVIIDALYGGEGDDTYIVNSTSSAIDIVFEGGSFPSGADDTDVILSKGEFFWDFYSVGEILTIDDSIISNSTMVSGTGDSVINGNSSTNFLLTYGGANTINPGAGVDVIDMSLYGLAATFNGRNKVILSEGDDTNYIYSFESGQDTIDVSAYHRFTDSSQMLANFVDASWGTYVWMGDYSGDSEFIGIVGLSKADLSTGDFFT